MPAKYNSFPYVQKHAVRLVKEALDIAGVTPSDIACIAYTKVIPAPGNVSAFQLQNARYL